MESCLNLDINVVARVLRLITYFLSRHLLEIGFSGLNVFAACILETIEAFS